MTFHLSLAERFQRVGGCRKGLRENEKQYSTKLTRRGVTREILNSYSTPAVSNCSFRFLPFLSSHLLSLSLVSEVHSPLQGRPNALYDTHAITPESL